MPPYSRSTLKRKYEGKYQPAKKQAMIRKSFMSYPIYKQVATAPAPSRVELKYDDGIVSGAISSTPAIWLLSTIQNGSGSNERIGRRITYFNLEMSWIWRYSANHGGPNHARFTILYDSAPNGAFPSYTDMFVSTAVQTLTNPDTRGRFTVLFDSRCISGVNDPAATGDMAWTNFNGHKVISLRGKHAHYIGTTDGIASMEKGAIYMVTNSYQNNVVAIDFSNRIQFSDA